MTISEEEFQRKLEEYLPRVLSNLGYIHSKEELATKNDIDKVLNFMDRRFEEQNQRFEEQNKKFEEQNKKFDALLREVRQIKSNVGALGNRTGHEFEGLVLSLLEEFITAEGIDISEINKYGLRNKDPDILNGISKITFDGYIKNDRDILLETKFSTDRSKVDWFWARSNAFEKITGKKPELWLVTVDIDNYARELAEDYGMKVITNE